MSAEESSSSSSSSSSEPPRRPVGCIVVGMAGSGKSTLVQRLVSHLRTPWAQAQRAKSAAERSSSSKASCPVYAVNLDPAVGQCSFAPNVDIRDTVKYRDVMAQFKLGPNGAIMTSLNLFATKFDQVVSLLERRRTAAQGALRYVLVDTPGQIEAFTWSASGAIFTDSLAATLPCVVLYVVDVPRSVANPSTFMANMLYACSILYRTRLPLVLALTKTDVLSGDVVLRWMHDLDAFQDALKGDASFAHDLTHSMSLVLEEFYRGLHAAGVSAVTGDGVDALLEAVEAAADEYFEVFLPDQRRRRAERQAVEERKQREQLQRLHADLHRDRHTGDVVVDLAAASADAAAAAEEADHHHN